MLQGCHRFLLMDVYTGVLLQDLRGLQDCNQTTKFSINIFSDLELGIFLFAFASSSLVVCHNSVEDPVGFNCANSVIWQKCAEIW